MRNLAPIINNLFTPVFHPSVHTMQFMITNLDSRGKNTNGVHVYLYQFFSLSLSFLVLVLSNHCFSELLRLDHFHKAFSEGMSYI